MVVDAEAEEPPAFPSLPVDLLCSVAEELDAQTLAIFAAACSACRAVAHEPLREALLKVLKRCLSGVRIQPWSPDRPHFTSAWEMETFKGCGKNLKLLLLGNLTGIASDRSVTPPQWLPMFLASAQPSSPPPPSPPPSPPPLPPPSPPRPSPSPPPPSPPPPSPSSPPPSPPPPSPPPSPPLSPPLPSPSPPRLARDLGAAGAAAVIGGYFFVNIVIIAIVKIYLRFRDWDRVELCRVLWMRVVSSCLECVAKVRSGPRARTDADADDATAAPPSRL